MTDSSIHIIPILLSVEEIEQLCIDTAKLSHCGKRKVGAVLVKKVSSFEYDVLATGANYNPDGSSCETEFGSTKDSVIHAEMACLLNFFNFNQYEVGVTTAEAQAKIDKEKKTGKLFMFVTYTPCGNCQRELDFYGITAVVVQSFMKFDSRKPRMGLVPASLGISCARALTYGAKKYKVNNWRKTETIEPYISALTRHLDAWREGEETDPESGLSHLDHIAANLCFLIELKDLPKINSK